MIKARNERMSRITVKMGEFYIEYSTIQDAPVEYGLKLEDYRKWYAEEYGRSGSSNFCIDVMRADRGGELLARDVIRNNCSGDKGGKLTYDKFYRAYCLREIVDGWTPASNEVRWRAQS